MNDQQIAKNYLQDIFLCALFTLIKAVDGFSMTGYCVITLTSTEFKCYTAGFFLFSCKYQCWWNIDEGFYNLCVRTGVSANPLLSREPVEKPAHSYGVVPDARMGEFSGKDV